MTDPARTEPYYRLGSYHRPTDTASAPAQVWFDRGMVWAYGFNHEESIRCFERALALDPGMGLARWGIAYAVGPNYNKAWEAFDPTDLRTALARARAELEHATMARATPLERDLISALRKRFPTGDPADAAALATAAGRRPAARAGARCPATCNTWPATSTCCAGTTARRSRPIWLRYKLTGGSSHTRGR